MILGTIMYVFIFWLGCTLTVENASANQLYIERSCFMVITLGIIFFSSNYRGVLDHIPLCKNQNKILKLTGIILLDIAFAFLILLVMAIIESIFVI